MKRSSHKSHVRSKSTTKSASSKKKAVLANQLTESKAALYESIPNLLNPYWAVRLTHGVSF